MASIQQQIDVAADPASLRVIWGRFIEWAHNGPGRLVCDELACLDAVRSGLVEFVAVRSDTTTVVFRIEAGEDGPPADEIRREIGHDLVVFKDYVERSGLLDRRHNEAEQAASEFAAGRNGDKPRHTRLSSEDDTTFWRSHFPT